MTCAKCKKKGHLAFNCLPKYNNKVRKLPNKFNKENSQTTLHKTHDNKISEQAANVNEFAGLTYQKTNNEVRNTKFNKNSNFKNKPTHWNPSKSFLHHKLRLYKLCRQKDTFITKESFYQLYFQDNENIYKTIIKELTKLGFTSN